jgi:hypothetical protein
MNHVYNTLQDLNTKECRNMKYINGVAILNHTTCDETTTIGKDFIDEACSLNKKLDNLIFFNN